MDLRGLQRTWDDLGRSDPLWAVLSLPGKRGGRWTLDEFLATGVREVDDVLQWLRSLGAEPARGRALDFGCGVGRLTQPFASLFKEAIGVDIAPSMIEKAREINKMGERCSYILNTREDLSILEDDSFDLIYSNITLQHMPPRLIEGYVSEFIRKLASGGVLVFQLPSSPPKKLQFRLKRIIPPALRSRWRRLRSRLGGPPRMQMYWMTPKRVARIVEGRGAVVIAMKDDYSAGPGWSGKRYAIQRGADASL